MTIQTDFRNLILRPTLHWMGMNSPAAEILLFGTAMHESGGLSYLRQVPHGPALGVYQMERATLDDLWRNWLDYGREDKAQWLKSSKVTDDPKAPVNLLSPIYATAAARLQYYRVAEPMPDADDIAELASYYKRHWNKTGKATEADFVAALVRFGEGGYV